MGARTIEAEQQVAQQRRRISQMLDNVEERTRRDIDQMEQGIAERASDIRERAADQIEQIPGVEALNEQVERHPLTAVLAGFGAGIAIGIAGAALMPDDEEEDEPRPRRRERDRGRRRHERRGGVSEALMGMLGGQAMGVVAGPLREEVGTLLRQALSGFLGNRADSDDRPQVARERSRRSRDG